jgi:hypothetical protein
MASITRVRVVELQRALGSGTSSPTDHGVAL